MIDLTNEQFGRLTVIEKIDKKWRCVCSCGKTCLVNTKELRNGDTKSCGCLRRDTCKERHTKHGLQHTDLYKVWHTMKARCLNTKDKHFKHYGQRGISICSDWIDNFMSFYEWSMSNGYKKGLTLDRIDNNGNYEPDNCRYVPIKIQANNRRSTHFVTYDGDTLSVQEWAERLNIKPSTLRARFNKGWSVERALSEKVRSIKCD